MDFFTSSAGPSADLFYPTNTSLQLIQTQVPKVDTKDEAHKVFRSIEDFMKMKNYPCVAALKSFTSKDFLVGIYKDFGRGRVSNHLRQDLLYYLSLYKEKKSQFLSFWAVFEGESTLDESQFEEAVWWELSNLTSHESRAFDRDPRVSDNAEDKNFCFSIGGEAFFVVGMHPQASRTSRRFPYCTLVFNVFAQFEQLERAGGYQSMVAINRSRDMKLQQSLNPMVEKYGEKWEAIQFSGKSNPPDWICPFRYLKKREFTPSNADLSGK